MHSGPPPDAQTDWEPGSEDASARSDTEEPGSMEIDAVGAASGDAVSKEPSQVEAAAAEAAPEEA